MSAYDIAARGKSGIYRQCRLERVEGEATLVDTAWIPTKLAITGKVLKVKLDNDEWQDGWKVVETFSCKSFDELQIDRWAEKRWGNALGK